MAAVSTGVFLLAIKAHVPEKDFFFPFQIWHHSSLLCCNTVPPHNWQISTINMSTVFRPAIILKAGVAHSEVFLWQMTKHSSDLIDTVSHPLISAKLTAWFAW